MAGAGFNVTAADWILVIGLAGTDDVVTFALFSWSLSWTDASTLASVTESERLVSVSMSSIFDKPEPAAPETELILSMLSVWARKSVLLATPSAAVVPLVLTKLGLPLKMPLSKKELSKTSS